MAQSSSRYDDAPPLAKLILQKVEKLDDYQKEKIGKQLDEDGEVEVLPARMTVLLRSAGITSTASQLRTLSTYFNGSSGGIPRAAVLDMIKTEEDLDDVNTRGNRNSADISYEMLQRLKGMRDSDQEDPSSEENAKNIDTSFSSPASMASAVSGLSINGRGSQRRDSIDSVSSDIGLLQRGFSAERLEYLKQATMATREFQNNGPPPENDAISVSDLSSSDDSDEEQNAPSLLVGFPPQTYKQEDISKTVTVSINQATSNVKNSTDVDIVNGTEKDEITVGADKDDQGREYYSLEVKTLTGKGVVIDKCRGSDTVLALKHWIGEKELIPPEQQRLLLGSTQLEDNRTLGSYSIHSKSSIGLVVRSRNSTEHHRRWSSTNLLLMPPPNQPSLPQPSNPPPVPSQQSQQQPERVAPVRPAAVVSTNSVVSEELLANLANQPRKSREFGSSSTIDSTVAAGQIYNQTGDIQLKNDNKKEYQHGKSDVTDESDVNESRRASDPSGGRSSGTRSSSENWFMKDRQGSLSATTIVYSEPKFFTVLSVAFVQGRPELDGDVQAQLETGTVVEATARRGDWLRLVAPEGEGEHWLYTGKQRSMDLLLSPLEDSYDAERLMRSQWSSRLTAIQSHLDAQKRASILEETEAVDRKASLTEGKSEEFMAPKGVISLAFTDIQGSTRLWEHFGESRMKALLDVHNVMMRKCLRRHRGYEVKTEGDAFMISFQLATQALGFAMDVQARLHEAKWPDFLLKDAQVHDLAGATEDGAWRGLRVRIGIHTGPCLSDMDPTTKRIDYFGHAVNLAARVESLAEGGEVVISQSAYDEVMGDRDIAAMKGGGGKSAVERMVEGLVVTCRGPRTLKGIKEPVVCWRVLPKGVLATRANTLKPAEESTMVVQPAGPVVGVETETKEVSLTNAEELCNEAVALHGAGDVGEAIILYRRALEMTKILDGHACRDPTILFNLGAALQASGDTDGAVGCFATILDAIDPDDTHARVQLGVTYHHAGHFTAAISHYMKALPLLGDDPETMVSVLVSLGEAQRDLGDINAAIASFSQAVRLNPEDEPVQEELLRLQSLPPQFPVPHGQHNQPYPPPQHNQPYPPPQHNQPYPPPQHNQPYPPHLNQLPQSQVYSAGHQPPPSFHGGPMSPPSDRPSLYLQAIDEQHHQPHQHHHGHHPQSHLQSHHQPSSHHHLPLHKRFSHEPAPEGGSGGGGSTDRVGKAFGRLGQAVAKWEKEHPLLKFIDFARTFDSSKQGNLSQPEMLKMLGKMKSATKLTERDLNHIWNRCEQYYHQGSGSTKINLEEMLTVMASYEVNNLQTNSLFGQEDELHKLRTGKKRMSTFAVALAKPPGADYEDAFKAEPTHQISSKSKNKHKGGGGLAKLMGKTSTHTTSTRPHYDRSTAEKPPLWPAERARNNRNSMLRGKLKAGREQMRADAEKHRLENLTEEEFTSERIMEERQEAQREEAERIAHEREARQHAAASARIAERNIEVAARRERLKSFEPDDRPMNENSSSSQYGKWSQFYGNDHNATL